MSLIYFRSLVGRRGGRCAAAFPEKSEQVLDGEKNELFLKFLRSMLRWLSEEERELLNFSKTRA